MTVQPVPEKVQDSKPVSTTLLDKTVTIKTAKGDTKGSLRVEVKELDTTKFIQLTQERNAFGNTPAVKRFITIDPSNEDVKALIGEAYKKQLNLFLFFKMKSINYEDYFVSALELWLRGDYDDF